MSKETPEFVKWADDEFLKEAITRIAPKESEIIREDFDISTLSYDEIRDIATILNSFKYRNDLPLIDKNRFELQQKLNAWVNKKLGNLTVVFDYFYDKADSYKFAGDERYTLLSRRVSKAYSVISALKSTAWFAHLQGKAISTDKFNEITRMLTAYMYWSFGKADYDPNMPGFEESEEAFNLHNEKRKKEIAMQDAFVEAVMLGEYDKAYAMIEDTVKKEM